MTTGSWSSGTVLGFTRTHQWIATIGETASTARVDVFWLGRPNWEGTEVCLEGLVGDDVVVSDCFIHPGATPDDIQHTRMEIAGTEFDRIRFICRGGTVPGELDGILAVFDNVAIEAGEACRADIDGDGELTIFDFLGYQNLFDAGDLQADFDGDGELTIFDFLAFQNEFDAGHAKVVADAARAVGVTIAGFVDDDPEARVPGLEHLGPIERAGDDWHLCIGDVATRVRVLESLLGLGIVIVHPAAIVSPTATLEAGVFVGPGAIVNADAHIEANAIVNSGAIIEHDARVGHASHIAPGSVLCGAVT
ncbi:UDP-N-acetylbacillosamine N-acetyltransferase, partial [Durusdinium trenchii]